MHSMLSRSRSADTLPPRARILSVGAALAGLLFWSLALAPARALAEGAQQYLVNDDRSGEENRIDPVAVRLDGGDFLVFWEDNTTGQLDLQRLRFRPDLEPAGDPALVNDDGGVENQFDLAISVAAGGRFAVTWLDERFPVIAVYAQVFSSDEGEPIGPNIELTADRTLVALRDRPAVATNLEGNSLVCWEENTFGLRRVRAQLLGETGQRIGSPFYPIPETAENAQQAPAVAALPDGGWLLAWEETVGSQYQVLHRLLAADGTPVTAPVNDHTESIADPEAGPSPAVLVRENDALLLWTDNRAGTSDLWGRWLQLDGSPDGEAMLMRSSADPARDAMIRGAVADDDSFALTWLSGVINQEEPLVRLFAANREPKTTDLEMAHAAAGTVARPGTALPLLDGSWLLAWSDDRSLSQQVLLRRVDATGTELGAVRQAWSVPASASQFLPDIALLDDGRAVVTWADLRGGTIDIYARLLDEDGRPTGQSTHVNGSRVRWPLSGPTPAEADFEHRPRIAASAEAGQFLITWTAIPGGGARALHGRLYDHDLQPLSDDFLVADPTGEQEPQSDPWPAMASNGRFAVAWRNVIQVDNGWDNQISIQFFDPLGQRLGAVVNPVEPAARPADQVTPAISISPYGDLVCAWVDYRHGQWDVFRRRLGLDGAPLEPHDVQLSDGAFPFNPAVVTNGSSIVSVWEDGPNTLGLIRGHLEVLETKGATRVVDQTDFIVNDFDAPAGLKNPRVAMDAVGRFIVVWSDERAGAKRVWCRRFDAEGDPLGVPYELPAGDIASSRQYPSVAVVGNRIQFVWGDTRRARGWDVITRLVDWVYNGEPVPIQLTEWAADSESDGLHVRWQIPLSATARVFRLWRDEVDGGDHTRPSDLAIPVTEDWLLPAEDGSFEVIDRTAPPGVPQLYYLESIEESASEFYGPLLAQWDPPPVRPWRAFPAPFRDQVELFPPSPGAQLVEIWDVQGRRVRALKRDATSEAPLRWDGRNEEGQELPAGLYWARPAGVAGVDGARTAAPALRLVRVR